MKSIERKELEMKILHGKLSMLYFLFKTRSKGFDSLTSDVKLSSHIQYH